MSAAQGKFRLAIVGTGGIAEYHLANIRKMDDVEVVGLCDIERSRAEAKAKEHGGRAYTDAAQMLDAEKPNGVLVCTPPFVRLAPIQAACDRGIPFFCEKPPAASVDDARKIESVVAKAGIVHTVGFMYRHLELVDRARELMKGRTLLAVRSTFLNGPLFSPTFPAWFKLEEKSGGPLLDQAIHALDLIRFLCGDVKRVFALGSNRATTRGPEVTITDTQNVLLELASGVGVTHNHTWASEPARVHIELIFREGHLLLDLREYRLTGKINKGEYDEKPGDDCYATEIRRFVQAARSGDGAALRSTYADGVKSLAVVLAANRSIASGKPETL